MRPNWTKEEIEFLYSITQQYIKSKGLKESYDPKMQSLNCIIQKLNKMNEHKRNPLKGQYSIATIKDELGDNLTRLCLIDSATGQLI